MQQVNGGKERALTRGDLTDATHNQSRRSKACREESAEPIVVSEMRLRRGEVNNR